MILPSQAHFGHDDGIDQSQPLEIRGLSRNLAFLFCYADAVVLVNEINLDCKTKSLKVEECLWSKDGMVVEDEIAVCANEGQYLSNIRAVVHVLDLVEDGHSFGIVPMYECAPSLMFIRKVETIADKWYHTPIFQGDLPDPSTATLPLYKVVNGGQGAFVLPHLMKQGGEYLILRTRGMLVA
ncbi:hypothetical protein [Persicirhabdus sediminis]|uniref:Uncharacterized protein n=1 Tax=Persicirhabdus sediminis TaxID=454144 RepID=A0A8J7MFR1_9BACT|nr:hypothetical protein [Persicirhabdus sediminis]MBK1791947.1 hypothetical protein [Persicirhabdus sediminis]